MPRLFFALTLPEAVADEVDDLCDHVSDARWVGEGGYHITLQFLGDVHRHDVSEVIEAGQSIRIKPFQISLESVGVFPLRGEARVLWAGVDKSDPLIALQRTLSSELRRRGFQLDKRKYHPHVTVARLHQPPPREVADWVASHLGFHAGPFYVRQFHLVSSVLGPGGSVYHVEESFGGLA